MTSRTMVAGVGMIPFVKPGANAPDQVMGAEAATLALASGGSIVQAAFLGSVAAATQAQRLGNSVISSADLRQGVHRVHGAHLTLVPPDAVRTRPAFTPVTHHQQQASA